MKTIAEYNQIFYRFAQEYDTQNDNILRKLIHSFAVAEKCFSIAAGLDLSLNDLHFAYLCGLWHDCGRFEQWRRFGSYNDLQTVDHGDLSGALIRQMTNLDLTAAEQEKLAHICEIHTKPTARDEIFDVIVKNADAYANIVTVANGSMPNHQTADGYTPAVLTNFLAMQPLHKIPDRTKLDRCLKMAANCYYVDIAFLRQDIINKKYLSAIVKRFASILTPADLQVFQQAITQMEQQLKV